MTLIKKDLFDVNESLERNEMLQLKYPEREGIKANHQILKHVQTQLIEKMENISKRRKLETIEVIVEGQEVDGHRISASYFGNFLTKLQDLLDRLYYAKEKGPDKEGDIPIAILKGTRLDVVDVAPGSFKVILSSHSFAKDQTTLKPTIAKESFEIFRKLVECKDNPELIREQRKNLGKISFIKYKKFLTTIYKNKSDIKFIDKSYNNEDIPVEISSEMAKNIYDIIRKQETPQSETEWFKGDLVKIDVHKYLFGFIFEDNKIRIDGKFNENLRIKADKYIDKYCNVKLKLSKSYNQTSEDYTDKWELLDIKGQ